MRYPASVARLLLADGSSQIHRTYHALARQGTNLTAPDGTPTGALIAFLNVLRKAVKDHGPTHVAVTFDLRGPTFRHELFPDYKAQRDKTPEDLVTQIALAREVLAALRIPILEKQGFEADDVIATIASRAAADGHDVVILSSDKDLLQLVGPHVVMHHALRDQLMDEAAAREYFGVAPEHVTDVLAIMGDTSDNIPGVKGIGDTGATALVAKYGTIENILESLAAIEADESLGRLRKRNAKLLREQADDVRVAKNLVTLRRDVPLEVTFEALVSTTPDAEATRAVLTRLGLVKLLADLRLEASAAAPPAPVSALPATAFSVAQSPADIDAVRAAARSAGRLALGLDAEGERMNGLALATAEGAATFVARENGLLEGSSLRDLLADTSTRKVTHDLKAVLRRADGLRIAGPTFDSMIASYVLDATRRNHELQDLATEHLGWQPKSASGDAVAGQASLAFGTSESRAADAAERATLALALESKLRPLVDAGGFAPLLDRIEMPLVPVLAEMEATGVRIDAPVLHELRAEIEHRLGFLTSECHRLAGREFNIASPRQLGEILFDHLGLESKTKTATGARSTAQDVLETLAGEHPIVDFVLEHRELSKLVGTYIEVLPRLVDPRTGRVHTTFNQVGAATGRLSSIDPNLQNIPIRTELGRRIRKAFVADEGRVLAGADYSQIELRIMAHLSGDEALCEAFARGEDIHRATAAKMFHVAPELVTPAQRNGAKVINFGLLYGMTAHGVATRLGCSRAEAKALIDGYFGAYPRMRETVDRLIEQARNDPKHEARTLFGRVRRLEELVSRNQGRRAFSERAAVNTVIQGTAADIMKIAMIAAHATLRDKHPTARLILQVHDELVVECDAGEADAVLATLIQAMESAHVLAAPLQAVGGVGSSWYDLK